MFIQDYLTLKVLKLEKIPYNIVLNDWDKIVYEQEWHKFVGICIWYDCEYEYWVKFFYKLNDKQLEKFYNLDKRAKDIFYNVRNDLNIVFPKINFITAKMNFIGNIVYIYFFSEDRVDFRKYLNEFRQLIGMNFFLYQLWSRDKIRLHPESKNICWDCWKQLCCLISKCKISSVETSTVVLQNLQTQWISKQKWICSKLKCCLKYEEDNYKDELKKFPKIWTTLEKDWKIYSVIGVNVFFNYVFLKDGKWNIIKSNFTK